MNIMLDLRKNICLYDFLQRLRRCKICIIFTMDVTMAIGIGCLRHQLQIKYIISFCTFTMDVTIALGLPVLQAGTSLKLVRWLIS